MSGVATLFTIYFKRYLTSAKLEKQKSPPRGTKGMITRQLDGRKLLPFRLVESEELDNVV
jgi:hypothetical protein